MASIAPALNYVSSDPKWLFLLSFFHNVVAGQPETVYNTTVHTLEMLAIV